ncbi:32422_t:CDS:2, partial [Racocetra persica]
KGLKDNGFHKAALTSLELWQNLGHTRSKDTSKIWWESFKNPSRHLAELAYRIFQLILHKRATKGTSHFSNIMSYEEDQIRDDETSSDTSNSSTTLLINEIVDLEIEEHLESSVAEMAQAVLSEDLDYNFSDVLNSFLECEKQNR